MLVTVRTIDNNLQEFSMRIHIFAMQIINIPMYPCKIIPFIINESILEANVVDTLWKIV